ncbi:MAG TPA: HAD family phosphatase [Pirellulaceae bacterium]|nr:HAD family phosphatase [Pirellulaceae bacterium]
MNNLGVIFDVDGVLVDSYQAHFDAWCIVGKERGFTISEEMYATSFGRTSREAIVDVFGLTTLSPAEIAELDLVKEAKYRELLANSFPELDGAGPLIDALHAAGFTLGVGSSGPPGNVDLAVDQLRRRAMFQGIITGNDVTRGKPDPQVFLYAAERMGIAPQRCCVIEDAPPGIEAAHAAGMKCIAVTSTGRTQAEQAAADWIVPSLREVTPAAIAKLIQS